jgi:NADH-quinone oxidoreductase subunit C
MVRHDIIKSITSQLGDRILACQQKSEQRVYLDIAAQSLEPASRMMLDEFGARLQIATGVDTHDGIEVMYHWALDEEACIITLRILLDHAAPELNSIALMCPAAEWIEREMWELLGIHFNGHPDLRHLLLADDWPEGVYPMRRNSEATS